MKFLDQVEITVKAGNGGNGSGSFRHAKFLEFGGPDGGDGGKGGDVIIEAKNNINTLIDFKYTTKYYAENGKNGSGKQKYGEKGKDLILYVPVGTEVIENETVLHDFKTEGERFTVAYGGRGGHGNLHYKSSTNRAPERFDMGEQTSAKTISLHMKLIADVGLIGFPNAGKSTFLSAVTNAKPKIGDYPFTTLYPNLGVFRDFEHEIIFADIPGLIEGASFGAGLGDRFLAHIERCKILIHLIDSTDEDAVKKFEIINHELKNYKNQILLAKKQIIVLNKIDEVLNEDLQKLRDFFKNDEIFEISAKNKTNTQKLLEFCISECEKIKNSEEFKE